MELLSPAGSQEALLAAVQNGADAVYMGLGSFNARRSARNFTDEDFARAVDYCHEHGVKVYLTLNTLLTDRELPESAEVLRKASAWGVDAVLVQDWGLWQLARLVAPDQPLHASTQMSLHTLSGPLQRLPHHLAVICHVPAPLPFHKLLQGAVLFLRGLRLALLLHLPECPQALLIPAAQDAV